MTATTPPDTLAGVDAEYIRRLLAERAGIVIDQNRSYLISSRLIRVAQASGMRTVADLINHLRRSPDGPVHAQAVEAMCTNETSFFRDVHPFTTLRESILPRFIASRKEDRALNIWSAGCATGQEAYSIAMILREHFPTIAEWDVRILATDISSHMLDRASLGRFTQTEVNRGLPASMLVRYFDQRDRDWYIHDSIRNMVTFRQMNLADFWPPVGTFDLILMRNVLIYFGVDARRHVLRNTRQCLAPDGYLLLGSSETTLNVDRRFVAARSEGHTFFKVKPERDRAVSI